MSKSVFAFLGLFVGGFFILLLVVLYIHGQANMCLPDFNSMQEIAFDANPFNPTFVQLIVRAFNRVGDALYGYVQPIEQVSSSGVENPAIMDTTSQLNLWELLQAFFDIALSFVAVLIAPIECAVWFSQIINTMFTLNTSCYIMGENNSDYASWSEWISGQQDSSLIGKVLLPPFNPLQGV